MANGVLGGGYSSRLNQEIRIKRGLSYGAGSSLSPRAAIGGFTASVQAKNESAAQVVGLIKDEMTRLAAEPASLTELAARKSVLVGDFGRDLGTSGGLAGILGNLAIYGVPLDDIQAYTGKVEAVSAADVQSLLQGRARSCPDQRHRGGRRQDDGRKRSNGPARRGSHPIDQMDLDSPTLKKAKWPNLLSSRAQRAARRPGTDA